MSRPKHIFLALVLLLLAGAFSRAKACQCPFTSLSAEECAKYELIFKGHINSVEIKGSKSLAVFAVDELYKGNTAATFRIIFDNDDPCKLEMRPNDEWIIYCNYYQVESAKLDFCSRSRKFIKNIKEDFFYSTTNVTYDEEMHFLQNTLGLHKLRKETVNQAGGRNLIPSRQQFVITLVCSVLAIVLFYYLFNKFFK